MKKLAPCFLLLALFCFTVTAFATESDQVPANFLQGMHATHDNPTIGLHSHGNFPTPHGFPLGVDTISNFTGAFEAQGVFYNNTPHQQWEYSMVGSDPVKGGTTTYNAPVIPVSLDLRNADGSIRFVTDDGSDPIANCNNVPTPGPHCHRLFYDVTPFVAAIMNGPIFQNATYSSSSVPTQFTDAIAKAEFGHQAQPSWHTLLAPSLKATRTMVLLKGTYRFALNADGSCCLFVLVSNPVFGSKLFPPAAPDNSTVIGSAEVAGDISTKTIATFLFPNTYLFNPNTGGCCTIGFHSLDEEINPANGQLQLFVVMYASYITPGLFNGGLADNSALSHEMSETFNDPFVGVDGLHNVTPFWLSPNGLCQDNLEVGDVVENLPTGIFPVTINGTTYHVQNEALLPWFEFQKNSQAIDNAYTYPDESVITTLSAPQPLNCGQQ